MSTVTHTPSLTIVHGGRPESAQLRTKLHVPGRPRHFLARDRLVSILDDLAEYPITALVAPAGAGKTVLAAEWLARTGRPCAWLTLDEHDRDPISLSHSLLDALQPLVPGAVADATRRLPATDDLAAVLAALRSVDHVAAPVTMVVDDLHRVDDHEAARGVLATFVEHRPPWLRLLLVSRRRPRLPVDRLRASGELADLDFGVLRFSDDEATALLAGLCPGLGQDELSEAVTRADGWAAALQLTALAYRARRFSTEPSSSATTWGEAERLVNQYLWAEVLRPESSELVGLLLSTAVVRRVNCGLAEALTERPDAGDLLDEAEAAGLFVTALDEGWFEVHSLVRHLLTSRLQRSWPDGVRKQHARAAQWFENAENGPAALEHWVYAERHADALRVLAELALPMLDAGGATGVLDAIEQIPADVVHGDPVNALRYAWCRLLADEGHQLDALAVAESVAASAPEPWRSRTAGLRAVSSWLAADWRGAATIAHGALPGTGEAADLDPLDRFGWRIVSGGIALDERWDDRGPDVLEARAACVTKASSRWSFEGTRAVGLALAGRPLDGTAAVDDARRAEATEGHQGLRHALALAEGIAARETDRRESARVVLEELAGTPTYPDPVLQLVAQLELVRLRLSAGDLAAAAAQLDAAESWHARLAASGDAARAASDARPCELIARVGVELALATDDQATALRWSAQVSDPFWSPVCEARILIACGRHDEAAHELRRATPRCPRHEVVSGLLLGQALAVQDRNAAMEVIVSALDVAATHGMLRTVASEGAPVMGLIELAAWCVPSTWMDRLRHAMVPVWTGQDAERPIDDLTDREREVLRLLPSRLTLSEIGSELYVSQNTVKFHVRAIYRKLGAASRAEAVDAARRMRLLPR